MTFEITDIDGNRETYTNGYDSSDEREREAGWDDAYMQFPDAEYIDEI